MLREMQLTPLRLLLGKVVDSVVSDRYERVTFASGGRREASPFSTHGWSFPSLLPSPSLLHDGRVFLLHSVYRRNLDARILLLFPHLEMKIESMEIATETNLRVIYLSVQRWFLRFGAKRRQNHECGKYRVVQGIERNRCSSGRLPWWHAIGPNSSEWPIDTRSAWERILKSAIFPAATHGVNRA